MHKEDRVTESDDGGAGQQQQPDRIALLRGVVGGAHDQRRKVAAESAGGADDAADRSDPVSGGVSTEPGEDSPGPEAERRGHRDKGQARRNLAVGPQIHDPGEHGHADQRHQYHDFWTEPVGKCAADRPQQHRGHRKPSGAGARLGQVEAVDVTQVGRQIGRKGYEAAEDEPIEKTHLPGHAEFRGGDELGNERLRSRHPAR